MHTADVHVATGLISEKNVSSTPKLKAYLDKKKYSREFKIPTREGKPYTLDDKSKVRVSTAWSVGYLEQISASDVVLVIGGGNKSQEVIGLCPVLEKPYVPVPLFGGSSKISFDKLRERLKGEGGYSELVESLEKLEVALPHVNSSPDSKECVQDKADLAKGIDDQITEYEKKYAKKLESLSTNTVKALSKFSRKNPFLRRSLSFFATLMVAVLVILAIWLACAGFVYIGYPSGQEDPESGYQIRVMIAIAVGCLVSVMLGSVSRIVLEVTLFDIPRPRDFIIAVLYSSSTGLLISFAMLLLLLLAQFPATGNFDLARHLNSAGDYLRMLVFVSITGFACTWLAEAFVPKLKKRIEAIS